MLLQRIALILFLLIPPCYADSLIVEPDMGRAPVLNLLNHAQNNINLVMYNFTDKTLLSALLNDAADGRNVRVILEKTPYKTEGINIPVMKSFNAKHLQWIGGNPAYQFTHQKTLVVDHQALIMTFNFTQSSFKNQRNFGVLTTDANVINNINNTFNADWNRENTPPVMGRLMYSPVNSRSGYMGEIRSAKSLLLVYAQSVDDKNIANALADAAARGVSVKLITSKMPRASSLQTDGVEIRISKKLYIHAKAMLIDHKTAVIGSINFTSTSLDKNRELAIIETDPAVTRALQETFENDWESLAANHPTPSHYQRTTSTQTQLQQLKTFARELKKLKRIF